MFQWVAKKKKNQSDSVLSISSGKGLVFGNINWSIKIPHQMIDFWWADKNSYHGWSEAQQKCWQFGQLGHMAIIYSPPKGDNSFGQIHTD